MTDFELLQIYLDASEWQTFEIKRSLTSPHKLLETVNAFANTDGGKLVLGLEDPKKAKGKDRIVGISEGADNVSEFLKLLEKEIEPPLRLWSKFELPIISKSGEEDRLIIFNIQKSDDIHSLRRGDTFVRRGSQNVKIGSSEIIRLKHEKGSLKFEDEIAETSTISDIQSSLLESYRSENSSSIGTNLQFLRDNGLAQKRKNEVRLTKAGILLFGNNPTVNLSSSSSIKISHYYGTEPSYSGEPNFVERPFSIEGPLINQIQETVSYFKGVVRKSPPRLVESNFIPTLLIPEWAFQEGVTNAVIHRNYFIQDDIQIRFFDDRIEIESPGGYPGHITPTNIRSERFKRNPLIARTLNRFQAGPNLDIGEGVDRIFQVMREKNLYDPIYVPANIRPNSVLLKLINQNKIEYWDTVTNYLEKNYRITNQQSRGITGIKDSATMSRLLGSWVKKGLIEKVESSFRGDTFYRRVGADLSIPPYAEDGAHDES